MFAFSKRLEAGAVDSCVMNKYICPVFLLDEAVALALIKPLHGSIRHSNNLLSKIILMVPNFRLPLLTMDLSLKTKQARHKGGPS
jgi:hypothetical protein